MLRILITLRGDNFNYEGTDPFPAVLSLIEKWMSAVGEVESLTQHKLDDLTERGSAATDALAKAVSDAE